MFNAKWQAFIICPFLFVLDIIVELTSVFNKHMHALTHPKAKAKRAQTILLKAMASL